MIGGPIGYPIGGVLAAGGDLNASLVVTLDDVTVISTGALLIAGTSSVTLDDVTVSSAATLLISGTLSTTLDDVTVTSDADLVIQAAASVALDDVTVAADAELEIHADAAVTLDDVTADAASTVITNGYLDVTLDDVTVFSDGNIRLPNTDADGDVPKNWKRPAKVKFGKKQQVIDLERVIAKAVTPPVRPNYTPDEWIALFNSLAGPAPDYAAHLADQIALQRQEEDDIELLLLSI